MSGSLPPPNYNPNDSLLSGGDTAKIIPVQGGGSMPGVNYNPDASLLSGGDNAKIEPVQGGGAKTALDVYHEKLKAWELRKEVYDKEREKYDEEYDKPLKAGEMRPPRRPRVPFPEPRPTLESATTSSSLSSISEENEENNNNGSSFGNIPNGNNISDIDVFVLDDNNDSPSANELASTLNEESNNENENENENEDENENENENENEDEEEKDEGSEVPCPVPSKEDMKDLPDSFEPSDDVTESKTKEIIRLASREYYIRIAKRKSASDKKDDEIMTNWKEGKFTEDEVDFLNTLGFSPKLLYTSFYCHQKDWKEELAEFMYYLSVNSCYPASSLLLKGECQRVREFLMVVESNLKAEQLRKLAEKPVPVAGPITLHELEKEADDEDGEGDDKDDGKDGKDGKDEKGHAKVLNRMKSLNVDPKKSEESKSIAKRITDFFKSMKVPRFLKSKEEKLMDDVLDEINKLEGQGKLNSNLKESDLSTNDLRLEVNASIDEPIDEEAMKRQFDEKMKELKIKKFMESLPPKYRNVDLSLFIERMVAKK